MTAFPYDDPASAWDLLPGNHRWAWIDECERQCIECDATRFVDADGGPLSDAEAEALAPLWPRYSYSLAD